MSDRCVVCSKEASKVCVGCEKALFCGAECSKEHWNGSHVLLCGLEMSSQTIDGVFTQFIRKNKVKIINDDKEEEHIDVITMFKILKDISVRELLYDLYTSQNTLSYQEHDNLDRFVFRVLFDPSRANDIQATYGVSQSVFKDTLFRNALLNGWTDLAKHMVSANTGNQIHVEVNTLRNVFGELQFIEYISTRLSYDVYEACSFAIDDYVYKSKGVAVGVPFVFFKLCTRNQQIRIFRDLIDTLNGIIEEEENEESDSEDDDPLNNYDYQKDNVKDFFDKCFEHIKHDLDNFKSVLFALLEHGSEFEYMIHAFLGVVSDIEYDTMLEAFFGNTEAEDVTTYGFKDIQTILKYF